MSREQLGNAIGEVIEESHALDLATRAWRNIGRMGDAPDVPREATWTQWRPKPDGGYAPCGSTQGKLPAGIYSVEHGENHELVMKPATFESDDLKRLPGGLLEMIVGQIEVFWERMELFHGCGLLHKRGILLHGGAGCGKTSVIKLLADDMMRRDGIVVLMEDPDLSVKAFRAIRMIEPARPIVHIIEDIEEKMEEWDCSSVLALLDGEHQIDNILQIATTNYPDKLEERVSQRPGRFDLVIRMDPPTADQRRFYLEGIPGLHLLPDELKQWTRDTEGMGISYLRELVASVSCLGLPYDETIKRLQEIHKRPPKAKKGDGVGFE
jgi:hypothetical protein